MSIQLTQSATAISVGINAWFLAVGGVEPYVYSVLPGGADGSIVAATGEYYPFIVPPTNPALNVDTIRVTDAVGATADAQILIGDALLLFCEIIQRQMGLPPGRVYLWDQKLFQPTDNDLYIAVSVPSCKPFGNVNRPEENGNLRSDQFVTMQARVDIDIISRGPAARDRKEEIILALASTYCQQQQTSNSFYVSRLSHSFLNLSHVDGAAIPYRYKISVNMMYAYSKMRQIQYFDDFTHEETIDP